MAGGIAVYEGTTVSNRLKVVGVDLTAIGDIDAEGKLECIVRCDPESGVYRKLAFKEDKIVGCLCLGDVKGVQEIQNAIESKIPVKDLKQNILEEEFDFKKLK
jgi:nitrite reductase (NADH) large subunit